MMENDTQLARWLAGELNEAELELLKKDPRYDTYERIKENFSRIESPQFDDESVLQHVLKQEKAKPVVPLYRKRWVQIAAMLVVFLGLAFAFLSPKNLSTANAQTYAFHLPDQSKVILNADSHASYRSWNWDSNRQIELNGEAYFKVAKGKKFVVKTDLGSVTVVGTQFNVKARDDRFDVVCYEGKVRVAFGNSTILLTPNQQVSFSDGQQTAATSRATEPQWLHRELVFSNEKLAGVIAEIERQYDVKIQHSAVSLQLFSGSLPGDNLDAALEILSMTYHLKVTKTANSITLTPINAGN